MKILLVEDNAGDVRLATEALKGSLTSVDLNVVEDGAQALAFLRREGEYAEVIRPDLILLDLNLPKWDGREVLSRIKADPTLKSIPVLILTGSRAEEDVRWAYEHGANCYLLKSRDLEEYFTLLRAVVDFWGLHARLPESLGC